MRQSRRLGRLAVLIARVAALGSRSCRRAPRARAGIEIAFLPITTAGDRDRKSPFGQIGERGVFVKEIEEALLAGRIDVAVHSAKDMTSTDTDGPRRRRVPRARRPARRARRRRRDPARHAHRHRVGSPARAAARARADGLGRAAARQRRHAPAQGAGARPRRARARGLRPRPARPRRRDRPADPAETMLPEAAQGALALQVRAGEEELVAHADDAETRRRVEAERACVATVGGGCLAPVAAHHDGDELTALIAAEDGSWVERRTGDDPAALAARARRRSAARAPREGRSSPGRAPGAAARRAARGARARGRRVPADRDRAASPTSRSTARGYDWLIVTSPNGADEIARRARRHRRRSRPSGRARRRRSRGHGIEPDFVPARLVAGRAARGVPAARRARCSSPPPRTPAGGPIDALGADFVPLYRDAALRPTPPEGDVVVLASGSAARAYAWRRRRRPAVIDRPGDVAASPLGRARGRGRGGDARPRRALDAVARRSLPGVGDRVSAITFLTDFGLQDDFVGVCHGVMKRIAPEAQILDITHGIPPQAVSRARSCSRTRVPYMPAGVHLAVVDPGVGGDRRAVAMRDGDGRLFVGPDNGLLAARGRALGGSTARARAGRTSATTLEHVSRTFHAANLRAGRRASRGRRAHSRSSARRSTPRRSCASTCRSRDGRARPAPRDGAVRRPLREPPAQPRPRARRPRSALEPGTGSSSARARRVLRGRSPTRSPTREPAS